jgi:hypothetical protein
MARFLLVYRYFKSATVSVDCERVFASSSLATLVVPRVVTPVLLP